MENYEETAKRIKDKREKARTAEEEMKQRQNGADEKLNIVCN